MSMVEQSQTKFGEVDIAEIEIDKRSRNEIPKLLRGLQYLWCNIELRDKMYAILEKIVPEDAKKSTDHSGMDLWEVLVLGTLRLNGDLTYDRVREYANQHCTLRRMLGHDRSNRQYSLQEIKENVSLLTPEVLYEIHQLIAGSGHELVRRKLKGQL